MTYVVYERWSDSAEGFDLSTPYRGQDKMAAFQAAKAVQLEADGKLEKRVGIASLVIEIRQDARVIDSKAFWKDDDISPMFQ